MIDFILFVIIWGVGALSYSLFEDYKKISLALYFLNVVLVIWMAFFLTERYEISKIEDRPIYITDKFVKVDGKLVYNKENDMYKVSFSDGDAIDDVVTFFNLTSFKLGSKVRRITYQRWYYGIFNSFLRKKYELLKPEFSEINLVDIETDPTFGFPPMKPDYSESPEIPFFFTGF